MLILFVVICLLVGFVGLIFMYWCSLCLIVVERFGCLFWWLYWVVVWVFLCFCVLWCCDFIGIVVVWVVLVSLFSVCVCGCVSCSVWWCVCCWWWMISGCCFWLCCLYGFWVYVVVWCVVCVCWRLVGMVVCFFRYIGVVCWCCVCCWVWVWWYVWCFFISWVSGWFGRLCFRLLWVVCLFVRLLKIGILLCSFFGMCVKNVDGVLLGCEEMFGKCDVDFYVVECYGFEWCVVIVCVVDDF